MSSIEEVSYSEGGTALTGHLTKPAGPARGAFVIFPNFANINEMNRQRAAELAEKGFVSLIADFYGEPVTDFAHAGEMMGKLRATGPGAIRKRSLAAVATLAGHEAAKGLKIGSFGFCLGGHASLECARAGADLVLSASFHGLLSTEEPAQPGVVKARLLVMHGDADPMVPRSQVVGFWEEMDAAGVNWHFHSYSSVKHGFTDIDAATRGMDALAYDVSADRQSWAAFLSLVDEVFGK